ncbi:hypothetical protein OIA45_41715 (plasmid) [Streptomyces chartreusis]|uniref:hypothetical protein n=1 Tax=Streptomyces chartreusis TaxID=1969 RepID=UPI002F9190ED|nr:hypothetical protein OIA45_41715 [Streptomyces chartreusis]
MVSGTSASSISPTVRCCPKNTADLMSTVATLSTWLILTNRSRSSSSNGSWTHRYEHGVPTTGLHTIAEQRHVRDHRPLPPGRVTAYGEQHNDR